MIVLFGDVSFDGRAKRMIEIARSLGEVFLVSTSASPTDDSVDPAFGHRRVVMKDNWGRLRRHLALWQAALAQARSWRPHVVFAQNFFTTLPGLAAARIAGAKLVYDAYELIIPEPARTMSARDCFWYLLERLAVPRADLVVAANPERAERMSTHYRLPNTPTHMRNIPPTPHVGDEERAEALRNFPVMERRLATETILIYQGDISLSRGIARFVVALDHLPDTYRMVVVGTGPDTGKLAQLAAKHTATGRFAALGRVPNGTLAALTSLADIGIVTYPYAGLNNVYCAPNKVFEYAQAGLPIVSSDQPPLQTLLAEYPFGTLLSRDLDGEGIAAAIQLVSQNSIELRRWHAPFLAAHTAEAERNRFVQALTQHLLAND
jgi:glycosyltransferase involved in cell wall biosynthesis